MKSHIIHPSTSYLSHTSKIHVSPCAFFLGNWTVRPAAMSAEILFLTHSSRFFNLPPCPMKENIVILLSYRIWKCCMVFFQNLQEKVNKGARHVLLGFLSALDNIVRCARQHSLTSSSESDCIRQLLAFQTITRQKFWALLFIPLSSQLLQLRMAW